MSNNVVEIDETRNNIPSLKFPFMVPDVFSIIILFSSVRVIPDHLPFFSIQNKQYLIRRKHDRPRNRKYTLNHE